MNKHLPHVQLFLLVGLFTLNIKKANSQTFQSSNLPIIAITTSGFISDDPKVEGKIRIIDNGNGQINHVTDSANNYFGPIGIETRGASSQWIYPKKSYGFETRDESGKNLDTTLLGMPAENDWILYAPYGDKTMLRNVLTYYLGNKTGHYASRSRFCELVINGEYQGVYVLLEKVKRNKNRVDISKLTETDVSGDDLTGGYIIKIDKINGSGGDGFYSNFGSTNNKPFFQYDYPDPEKITSQQKTYIQSFIHDFESELDKNNFDPQNGYSNYIDLPSFVDYMIITEVCKNIDGYRLSTYLYKEKITKGGKLHIGPLWDYNLAYGNADYCGGESYLGWAKDFTKVCPDDVFTVPFWWDKLLMDAAFTHALNERWTELRKTILSTSFIHNFIDSTALTLEEPQQRNFQKWPILGEKVWPNYYVGHSYQDEVNYLKDWIKKRLDWMDVKMNLLTPNDQEPNILESFHFYPNPFNRAITFTFSSPFSNHFNVKIYDLMGKELVKLQNPEPSDAVWTWDGKINGIEAADGFYITALEANGKTIARKKIYKKF